MEEQDFKRKMENLSKPEVSQLQHQQALKIHILSARKSAAIGIWLIVIPCYFLFCIVMKYYFRTDLHMLDITEEFFASLDKHPVTHFLTPILFAGFPILSVILNALAITHFDYRQGSKELIITLKLRWFNIILLGISLGVMLIFLLYAIAENFNHA